MPRQHVRRGEDAEGSIWSVFRFIHTTTTPTHQIYTDPLSELRLKKRKKERRHIKAKTIKVRNKTSNVISEAFCVYVCVYVPRQGKKRIK